MSPLPDPQPKRLSLGPLEAEVLNILWELESATVKEIRDRIVANSGRELTQASVTTVLGRLDQKGWLICDRQSKTYFWQPLLSREQARILKAYEQLQQFLAVSNPDIVASFADELDEVSLKQLEAIAQRLKQHRLKQHCKFEILPPTAYSADGGFGDDVGAGRGSTVGGSATGSGGAS
ncbi:MAG: CopY family transcriptional regulator [Leptolyngbyaceae cyanobacterium CRU_2_3]|nr:CopY family transcriptional regulator [Leptolyngbyaceae cyanobacterium CRU_2_3]